MRNLPQYGLPAHCGPFARAPLPMHPCAPHAKTLLLRQPPPRPQQGPTVSVPGVAPGSLGCGGRQLADRGLRRAVSWPRPASWQNLGRAALGRPASAAREEEITDLKVLVDAIREANVRLAIPAQHSPWLPALDSTLLLDDIPAVRGSGALPPAPYGIEDRPADQARRPVALDFATSGHLMIGGAPPRAAAGPRCCAPWPVRRPVRIRWPMSTSTASTAATARSTP
jgi:hypothetical protein